MRNRTISSDGVFLRFPEPPPATQKLENCMDLLTNCQLALPLEFETQDERPEVPLHSASEGPDQNSALYPLASATCGCRASAVEISSNVSLTPMEAI